MYRVDEFKGLFYFVFGKNLFFLERGDEEFLMLHW